MHKVSINGKTEYAPTGTLLSDLLKKTDADISHPCGGLGICKKCTVMVNGRAELSCRYRIESDITVILPEKEEIVSQPGEYEEGRITENLCFVLDIGTTTLALALVSLDEKRIIRVLNRTNPQRKFGADVISRIDYCRKNGVSELQRVLIEEINSMAAEFNAENAGILYASGNTTMLHILFGADPSGMGVSPYTPVFTESRREEAEKTGIRCVKEIISLPSVCAFVGADITAGLIFADRPSEGRFNLLVDLGTNAEIVLYSADSAICTSAAAGPCFEGANISCGMSAVKGAIYACDENGFSTVGGERAKGICGTGLVDIIALLLKTEVIDETGYMECESFVISGDVTISRVDIRQYQLAKSAVCSAVETLLKHKGVSFDEIERMYISGGFSAGINTENAVKTGLFPEELKDKCVAINNSSLMGTVKYACGEMHEDIFSEGIRYIDLSADSYFSQRFIENMMFEI